MKQAFAYTYEQLVQLAACWEDGATPAQAAPFIADGLLTALPPHYELTDAGRHLLDHYSMYRPYLVQARSLLNSGGWESRARFTSESAATSFIVRLQAITHLSPRAYRILNEQRRLLWSSEVLE